MFATLQVMYNHSNVAGRVNSTQAQTACDADKPTLLFCTCNSKRHVRQQLTPSGAVLPLPSSLEVYRTSRGGQVSEAEAEETNVDSGTHCRCPSTFATLVLHRQAPGRVV